VWTYRQLFVDVAKVARSLDEFGVKPGDRVGVLSQNSPLQVQLFFALSLKNAIIVPLKTRLKPPELESQISDAKCHHIFVQNKLAPKLSDRVKFARFSDLSNDVEESFIRKFSDPLITPNDTLSVFYTSGTTGKPKGAVLSYQNFLYSAMANAMNIGVREDDLWLACLPLDHIGGFSIYTRSVIYGTSVFLQEKFDAKETLKILQNNPVTIVSLVPTMLKRLLDLGLDIHSVSLRVILLGGARPEPELVTRALQRGLPVIRSYGMTETCSQVIATPYQFLHQAPESSGRPMGFTQVKIVDENGSVLSKGIAGEILIKSPTVMKEYWNDTQATSEVLDQDGWLHTRDYGYLDERENLYTISRRENLIVTGGENVIPEEVESVLNMHPDIEVSCVFGIDASEWGQKVVAAIQINQSQFDRGKVKKFLVARLANYKIPKEYFPIKELPRTGSGKINRAAIIKQYLSNINT